MKIVADMNIPFIKEAFTDFGEVITVSGRQINNELIKNADLLLVRSVTKVNKELLDGTSIKFVGTATIGEDHIDKNYLHAHHIGFSNAPGSNANSVAEYIICALQNMAKKFNLELDQMTLGIIGVGNVGSRVLKNAEILGINCLLNDPPQERNCLDKNFLPLITVLQKSDIITVHVPLNPEGENSTYHLINDDFLNQMRPGAILLNTSRGKVMDENAILAHRNNLKALILDVWENEPHINLDLLEAADIATPHIAGYSYDGKIKGAMMIYKAACNYFSLKDNWEKVIQSQENKVQTIDLENSNALLLDAINTAYPIMDDDKNLRKICQYKKEERANYFDELRKNYPKRPEFCNYKINLPCNAPSKIKQTLKSLGFQF